MGSTGFKLRGLDENATHDYALGGGERRSLPNMRQLRVFLAVSNSASMQAAASALNTSRSSITKAIKKLETQVGAALLVRTSRRLALTSAGSVVAAAARRMFEYLQAAELEIVAATGRPKRRFAQNFTNSQLAAFLAVISHRSHTLAATRLKVSQPAITMALRDLQNAVGAPLLEKGPDGIAPNALGLVLAEAARRAVSELEDLRDVVKPGPREARERVVVGVLPLAGTLVPARAVESFLSSFPRANLTLVEGPYASLLRGLRSGDIDVIIGGLSSPASEPDISHQKLYHEEIMAAVRTSHPLAAKRVASIDQLLKYNWIVPRTNTPARTTLEQLLSEHDIPMPSCVIETNSVLTTRSLLMEGNRIAFITRSQVQVDERSGVLCTLGLDVPRPHVPIGVRLRVDCRPSDTLRSFLGHLHRTGLEYVKTHH